MIKKINGIIFDLDGVLTDTSRYHYLAWKHIAHDMGVYFNGVINERLKGVDRTTSLEIILERSAIEYTIEEKRKIADTKNEYYLKLIDGISQSDLYPGVNELLEEIKAKEIKAALGSASKNALIIIKKLGIEQYFDGIVDANLINKGKPDPEIFITAADMIGLKYEECAVIEDSAAGIKAAKSAGMIAVGIGKKKYLSDADIIYPEIKDMKLYDIECHMLIT